MLKLCYDIIDTVLEIVGKESEMSSDRVSDEQHNEVMIPAELWLFTREQDSDGCEYS